MLEQVNLKKTTAKSDYKAQAPGLKDGLGILQQRIKTAGLPVVILFEGWGAAGKGGLISDLILNFDPRGFHVYSTVAPTEAEKRKPLLWRHWQNIPGKGEISVLDRSWYQDISAARVEQTLTENEVEQRTQSIRTFERQLADDGCLLIKFFLHISQKEQKERFDKLDADKNTEWRVTEQDRKRNRRYEDYYAAIDEMLEATKSDFAPWHVVSGHDKPTARLAIFRTVTKCVEDALSAKERGDYPPKRAHGPEPFSLVPMPKLNKVDLSEKLDNDEYKKLLKKDQKILSDLHNELYRKQVPVVIAYEGWDAAGKGGNIKRVAEALDPRGYDVIPIAAPDKYELSHHYLWRFWKQVPKTGHIAIFDRTWYGRVMVERIEGFCTTEEWKRAYQEINEFEKELYDWGAVVLKFWLQVDKDEQLARFTDRQNTPEKQWKITDEDWRNREKWPQYEKAVNEMLAQTSTDFAPWHIIQSQDKKYGRIQALEILIKALEERL